MRKTQWLLLAGAPLVANCSAPSGTCGLLGGPGTHAVYSWDGGLADGGTSVNGVLDQLTCNQVCSATGISFPDCTVVDAGLVSCDQACVGGRAPPGLVGLAAVDRSAGSWLARMAQLEAAAVQAFIHLAKELDAHGLPRFASYALRAAEHEVDHATRITRLALRYGHCPSPVQIQATGVRSLEAVAIDNAGEGCGRELFGSQVNLHQAHAATDPDVAATMAAIAGQEAQHARFSFALSRSLMPRLSIPARRRAREAQAQVLEKLASDEVDERARGPLGLMDQHIAQRTARTLLDSHRV